MTSPVDWSDEGDEPPSGEHARRRALGDLRTLYRLADEAYRPYRCPAAAECCQLATTGREPWLWPVEWKLLLQAAGGRAPPARADGGCPFLDAAGARCSVYAERPFGCRTFFCHRARGPRREPLERMAALSRRLEALARMHDPDADAPRPLRAWHSGAVP
ncbi:MAG TPA: YkgJ family cysteine cluster protein [Myxococcaceae bacterium]|nr:YkgJ family cysteine cluster protein [Myxococcaceae bacterium]